MKGPLAGHGLASEGAPHTTPWCREDPCARETAPQPWPVRYPGEFPGEGHALCSCGATSGHLPSGGQRKAWHRDHKSEIAAKAAASEESR